MYFLSCEEVKTITTTTTTTTTTKSNCYGGKVESSKTVRSVANDIRVG